MVRINSRKESLKKMIELQLDTDAEEFQLISLQYAQHFAKTNRNPGIRDTRSHIVYPVCLFLG